MFIIARLSDLFPYPQSIAWCLPQSRFNKPRVRCSMMWEIAGEIKDLLCHGVFSGAISPWGLSGEVPHAVTSTSAKQYARSLQFITK